MAACPIISARAHGLLDSRSRNSLCPFFKRGCHGGLPVGRRLVQVEEQLEGLGGDRSGVFSRVVAMAYDGMSPERQLPVLEKGVRLAAARWVWFSLQRLRSFNWN